MNASFHLALLILAVLLFILAGLSPWLRADGNISTLGWFGLACFAGSFLVH